MSSDVLQVRVSKALGERFRSEAKSRGVSMGKLLQVLLDGEGGQTFTTQSGPELESRILELERRMKALELAPAPDKAAYRRPTLQRPAQARRLRVPPKVGGLVRVPGLGSRPDKVTPEQAERLKSVPEPLPKTPAELREFREGLGITVSRMAQEVGVSRGTYRHWEGDHVRLGGVQLLALMDWYETQGGL